MKSKKNRKCGLCCIDEISKCKFKTLCSECSKIRTHILKKGRDSIIDFISKTGERIVVVNPSAPPNY